MPKPRSRPAARPSAFTIDGAVSLTRGLAAALRESVLTGQLRPGARVPSTRALAAEHGVSRNTALDAYAQLVAEGYFETRRGAGTFVAPALADDASARRSRRPPPRRADRSPGLSARGRLIASTPTSVSDDKLRAFSPGLPSLDPALFAIWGRVAARRQRRLSPTLLNYGDDAGHAGLREAIAAHLGPTRGVLCTPDQIVITGGTQQGLDFAARLLTDPGDAVWLEDPGYTGARAALAAGGAELVPVPVDEEGLRVDQGERRAPRARLAYVSPSHQYPTGVTMSLARRLRLLEWAERAGAWILEDDYDSEFRYGTRPLPALQGLDRSARVLYFGTFSKVLFPALRLGYVVAPAPLVPSFRTAAAIAGHGASGVSQAVLADFIVEGHFARHVRRLRARYEERRALFVAEMRARLGRSIALTGAEVGLHICGRLTPGIDDRDVSRRAAAAGLTAPALSDYYLRGPEARGLVLGYGHLTPDEIRAGVRKLANVVANRESKSRIPNP